MEGAILDGLAVIDAAVREATDGRRARTHPHDPLPGFTPLVRPARRAARPPEHRWALIAVPRSSSSGPGSAA